MKTRNISVPSGIGLPIISHFLSSEQPVCLGAFRKFRNPFCVLHTCGKATLWDYHVVNYPAFHPRGCFAGRMSCSPRWSRPVPVPVSAAACTLLTPTAIPAPTLHASELHQSCFILGRKLSQAVLAEMQTNGLGGLFCQQTRNVPQSGWLSWRVMVAFRGSLKPT